MLYAYQMFGQLNSSKETRIKLFNELNDSFEPWEGLVSRTVLWDEENEIGNVIYLCRTQESALRAKKRVKELVEKYDEIVGYTTELLSTVVGQQFND